MIGFPRNKPALFIPYLRRACAPPTTPARCRWSPRASRPCWQVSGTSRTRRCSEPNRQMMQRLSLQRPSPSPSPSPSPQRLRLSLAPTRAAPALTCATSHSARPAAHKTAASTTRSKSGAGYALRPSNARIGRRSPTARFARLPCSVRTTTTGTSASAARN